MPVQEPLPSGRILMYFKLALRNAKRSVVDYLLYILTMTILISIMFVSDYIAVTGRMVKGFQTASLPLLITVILIILTGYIDDFMLKQRAKEFANYMLLGMKKSTVVHLFLVEFFIIGLLCLAASVVICSGICFFVWTFKAPLDSRAGGFSGWFIQSLVHTCFYFFIIEIISMYGVKRRMDKMEIQQLMMERKRNQNMGNGRKYRFWSIWLAVSVTCMLCMFWGIAVLPEGAVSVIISFIAIPLLGTIFTFYKWLFQRFASERRKQTEEIYEKERLYIVAKLTSGTKTNALMNGVFCMCLLFSSMSFIFGTFMLQTQFFIWDADIQKWMGFLQICLCLIFIVIYFSILSLQQMIDIRQQSREMKILSYMGRSSRQLKCLVKKQILLKLSIPMSACFLILAMGTPFVNYRLNTVLPEELGNIWLKSLGGFLLCFLVLYLCYCFIVFAMSWRYIGRLSEIRHFKPVEQ